MMAEIVSFGEMSDVTDSYDVATRMPWQVQNKCFQWAIGSPPQLYKSVAPIGTSSFQF